MMRFFIFISLIIYTLFASCKNYDKNESKIADVTLEKATRMLDSLKKNNPSSEKENLIISPGSSLFNKQEADLAYSKLMKTLIEKRIIKNEYDDGQAIEIDSYDATDSCYKFRVLSPSPDKDVESNIIGWWKYFPRTKKVVNGITFEVIN